jgi:hypothetical protein
MRGSVTYASIKFPSPRAAVRRPRHELLTREEMTMNVDLMYFEGCPHWRETAGHLEALRQVRGDFDVRLVEVTTPEAADEWRFHGSPSVAINGIEPT